MGEWKSRRGWEWKEVRQKGNKRKIGAKEDAGTGISLLNFVTD